MWFLNVPKKFHIFWSGGSLPFLRYLTARTFKALNPDWEIHLWTSLFKSEIKTWNSYELNYPDKWDDWTEQLYQLCDIVHEVDFSDFGISNKISEVHKSDLLRYYFLNEYGGVYSDTDILYFSPITKLGVNNEENKDKETFVCISHYGHSNGFFMASEGSSFFGNMFKWAKKCDLLKYQSNGPDLCNKLFPTIESINKISPAANIGMEAVYLYDGQHVDKIYTLKELMFAPKSIGIHWYAGHPLAGKFLNATNGGLQDHPDNIIGKLCKSFS